MQRAPVTSNHPLAGRLVEEENPAGATTVVYTITTEDDRLSVSGVDQSDGVALAVSKTSFDGEKLTFVTRFPPTNHVASHRFVLIGEGRAKHEVSYTDRDQKYTVNEVWKRVGEY